MALTWGDAKPVAGEYKQGTTRIEWVISAVMRMRALAPTKEK